MGFSLHAPDNGAWNTESLPVKFAVGDMVVLLAASDAYKDDIGRDYQVVGFRSGLVEIYSPHDICREPDSHQGEWVAQEASLKLIKPPEKRGSWEEVEKITGWTPVKEPVSAG